MDLDAPIKMFASSFNEYVDAQNESSRNNGNSLHSDKERPGRAGNQAIDELKSPSDFG
jgi:hypothetical protein